MRGHAGVVAAVFVSLLLPPAEVTIAGAVVAGTPRDAAAGVAPVSHEDPPPRGVRVGVMPSTAELLRSIRKHAALPSGSGPGTTAAPEIAQAPSPSGSPTLPGLWSHTQPSCTGSGADGNRVQVVYVVERGQTNRFKELLPVFLDEIANADDVIAVSSQKTGGGRRVRWVHDPATCLPSVADVTVEPGELTKGNSFESMKTALIAKGFNRLDRKYLVLADAATTCGLAEVFDDPRPATDNLNNGSGNVPATYARVDAACWVTPQGTGSILVHELMHMLGAVQEGGTNYNVNNPFHCTDNYDLLCYGGSLVRVVCPASHEPLLDCNNDDYFNTNPPPGSPLATAWNSARSSFLNSVPALVPPVAVIAGPTAVAAKQSVKLSAAPAAGTTAAAYAWTLPPSGCSVAGGTSAATLSVSCASTGSYQVSVRVDQSDGQIAAATRSLVVTSALAPPPTISVGGPAAVVAGSPMTLTSNVSASLDTSVAWSGLPASCAAPDGVSGTLLTFTCSVAGAFTVTATATQADGQVTSADHSVTISPAPAPPPAPPPPAKPLPVAASSAPIPPLTPAVVSVSPPRITVAGPARVRAGTPAVLTAAGPTVTAWSWSASSPCLVSGTRSARATVTCPTNRATPVTVTVVGRQGDGQATRVVTTVAMGGAAAALTPSFAIPAVILAGQRATLTGTVRFGRTPVRAIVAVESSTDGRSWRRIGTVDTGAAGRLSFVVRPTRSTYFRLSVLVAARSGWRAPAPVTGRVVVRASSTKRYS